MNVGNLSSVASMAQEALETAAQTKAEATKSDEQAILKLAKTKAATIVNEHKPVEQKRTAGGLDLFA